MPFTYSSLPGLRFAAGLVVFSLGVFGLGSTSGSLGCFAWGCWAGLGCTWAIAEASMVFSARIERSFSYVCVMDQQHDKHKGEAEKQPSSTGHSRASLEPASHLSLPLSYLV